MDQMYRGQIKEDPGVYHRDMNQTPMDPFGQQPYMAPPYGYYQPPTAGAFMPPSNVQWMGAPRGYQQPMKDPMVWDPPSPKREGGKPTKKVPNNKSNNRDYEKPWLP